MSEVAAIATKDYRRIYVFFVTAPKWVTLGVAHYHGPHASITLLYPERDQETMLIIAEEMRRQDQQPKLFLRETAKGVDVLVLFRFLNVPVPFLAERFPIIEKSVFWPFVLRAEERYLIATGEATIPRDALPPFVGSFKENGLCKVFLVTEADNERQVLWHTVLTEYQTDWGQIPALVGQP